MRGPFPPIGPGMHGNSRPVTSRQQEVHPDLARRLDRHLHRSWQRPPAAHSVSAFARADARVRAHAGELILDAGCGTGASCAVLAERHPGALVVGVDKSAHRLQRGPRPSGSSGADLLVPIRADLLDVWRLALVAGWRPARQYLLYPNPWPKPAQLGRRWHGHPVFPYLLALGGALELRSNWPLYVEEFAAALAHCGVSARLECFTRPPDGVPVSPFESKYLASGQTCWRLRATLDGALPPARVRALIAAVPAPGPADVRQPGAAPC